MKKFLVIMGICLVTLFSFTSNSEAAWEIGGEDPDMGKIMYDTDSIVPGKELGSINYEQAVRRQDGVAGLMVQSYTIDAKRMYATVYWVKLTDANGNVVASEAVAYPLPIMGMKPALRNVVNKVIQFYESKYKGGLG